MHRNVIELKCFEGSITEVRHCPDNPQHRCESSLHYFTMICGVMPCPLMVNLSICHNLLWSKETCCCRGGACAFYSSYAMMSYELGCHPYQGFSTVHLNIVAHAEYKLLKLQSQRCVNQRCSRTLSSQSGYPPVVCLSRCRWQGLAEAQNDQSGSFELTRYSRSCA